MIRKSPAATAVLFLALLLSPALEGAVFLVPSDLEMIQDADAIVLGRVDSGYGAFALNGDIVTHTKIVPERVLKGTISAEAAVEIRDLGGVVGSRLMAVSGGVSYAPRERVLLFLQKDEEGYWTTYGMVLGKMKSARLADGTAIFTRDLGAAAVGLSRDGQSAHVEFPRSEAAFLQFIAAKARQITTGPREPLRDDAERGYFVSGAAAAEVAQLESTPTTTTSSAFTPATDSHYPPSAYTHGTFRWDTFDKGGSQTYYVSGSQPNYDSLGAAQRSLAAWTNEPNSNVRLVYGGTNTRGFVEDDVNTIVFNSSTGVPSGAIGYSKWFANATHTYKGETFYSIAEGDVVMRSGLTVTQKVFDEAVAHEVGHTLGFRHSDQGTPTSNAAVMRSAVTGTYGAALGPWDVEAVTHVYTNTTTTPPCTPPSITTQPQSTTTSGTSTTLNVGALGTAPLTYQWYVGTSGSTTTPVAGATGPSLPVAPTTTTSYWVRVSNACGAVNSSTATITVAAPPPPPPGSLRGDFNGDGNVDLIWRNESTGVNRVWYMNGTTVIGSAALPVMADLAWSIGGVGDMNGDGRTDIIWRNAASGQNSVWFMNNTTRTSYALLPSAVGAAWTIGSVVDWDGDGDSDMVWRNTSTGQNSVWIMNGATRVSVALLPTATVDWELAGSGDTDLDGQPDLFWRNRNTGQVSVWFMNPTTYRSARIVGTTADLNWRIQAVADLSGDGRADLVWRNVATGANSLWIVSNGVLSSSTSLQSEPDLNWRIAGPR